MTENNFYEEIKKLNIELSETQKQQFSKYYELLVEWNNKINLTAITEKNEVYLKHFYDSATIVKAIDLEKYNNLCDIGTGAGLPGIVIKILFPKLKVTLVDSLNKRIVFLKEVIKELNLENIEAIHSRVEEFEQKETFDIVTCRAVSHLSMISEFSIPLLKVNGYFIPLKGNINDELNESKKALKILNSNLEEIISFELPIEMSTRNILKIKKLKHTGKYPRKFSEIKKKRL